MAKITITGDAVVITSALKLEEIKKVAKYRPKALRLYGGEDGKEEIFRIAATDGTGSIGKYGAEFNGTAHDGSGKATITTILQGVEGDIKEVVADTYGPWVNSLNKLEEAIPAVLAKIEEEHKAILDNIKRA